MRPRSEDPVVLISSSFDLYDLRIALSQRIQGEMQSRGSLLGPFRWEEETEGGNQLDVRSPVQRQIDDMLAGRIALTIVMFGERIGEAMRGELPDMAQNLLADWEQDGLFHPWPSEPAERNKLLAEGKFPLTGTVYELLVGLHKGTPGDIIAGFVADREVLPDTQPDGIMFNNRAMYKRDAPSDPLSKETRSYVDGCYRPQVHALLNLLKALTIRRGLMLTRCTTAEQMEERLGLRAVELLEAGIPDRTGQLPFKSTMEHYRFGDPLPLPDRRHLRRRLKERLLAYGKQGEMLALEGPSGCGKSSLMQKGLLEDLPFDGNVQVVVFRPGQLESREERTPFLSVTALIAETLERRGLSKLLDVRSPLGNDSKTRAAKAASALNDALSLAKMTLVLAIDQFEDVVDWAELQVERRDTAKSWWQVLRFLGAAAGQPHIFVVGTLENLRKKTVEELDFPTHAGLVVRAENVDFPVGEVRDLVRETATFAKLPLSRDLIDQIQTMVENFEKNRQREGDAPASASFVPLLSIWLYRLFATFQDRMGDARSSISGAFDRSTNELTWNDLKERGIDLELAQLVGEMVQDAWGEAGQLGWNQTGYEVGVNDKAALWSFIESRLQDPDTARIIRACRTSRGFDLPQFWGALNQKGLKVPGVVVEPVGTFQPHANTIENFLSSLVSVDGGGTRKMRLTDIPTHSSVDSLARLIAAHRKRRLLVPAGTGRVRLVHQAVVDNWEPARKWFHSTADMLALVRRMERVAEDVDSGYKSIDDFLRSEPEIVRDAVRVLRHKRGLWSVALPGSLSERDERVRRACLAILRSVEDGALSFDFDGISTTVAHEAARYDLAEAIERWLTSDPSLVEARDAPRQETLLHKASWAAEKTVEVLVRHGAKIAEGEHKGWHPITNAIQTGRKDIFDRLFVAYRSGADKIGPGGFTLLHEAARAENPSFLRRMLESTVQADVKDEAGDTPFHDAARNGRIEQARLLVACCDPTTVNEDGYSAIHLAALQDHGALITALLRHEDLSDADRAAILTGDGTEDVNRPSPMAVACVNARPNALAALLAYCDPLESCHRVHGHHPIANVTGLNSKARGGSPLADRVSECVRLLLKDGRLSSKDAAKARGWAGDFPDVQRQIDEWLITREDFDDVPQEDLLRWLAGPRAPAAITVLTKAPGILDATDTEGTRGATRLLYRGHKEAVAAALSHGVEPTLNPEMFRLEAALRLLKEGEKLPDRFAVPAHPVVGRLLAGEAEDIKKALFARLADDKGIRTLLHRLALHNEVAAFHAVLSGLRDPIPLDIYGRLPSALAPPSERATFAAIEAKPDGVLQ